MSPSVSLYEGSETVLLSEFGFDTAGGDSWDKVDTASGSIGSSKVSGAGSCALCGPGKWALQRGALTAKCGGK